MSKDRINLDFSSISTSNTKLIEKQPEKKEEKVLSRNLPSNIIVALDRGERKYLFKDLVNLTGEEFLEWAARVYPVGDKNLNPRDFDSRTNKIKAFETILRFHDNAFLSSKRDDKIVNQ